MIPSFRTLTILLLCLYFYASGKLANNGPDQNDTEFSGTLPQEKTEFRAVWIATINNIDWPSKPNLTVNEQKKEFLHLLNDFQRLNLNVVILQVRAASDAFYQSRTEPWSLFLTGKQGRAPLPFYDPLAWAIEMCHQRGMELHAWFNPFRVRNSGYYPLDPKSFAARNPQYVREFDKKYFLDPGYPEVRKHVVEVIAEVARNYDVDAILLDDYFYPYPVQGKNFGDDKSFAKYGNGYFPKRIKDWRRNNISLFIESLHDTLRQIDPDIKFGISPFGIWRNKSADPEGSPGLRGLSSYDDLYADVRKWLKRDWIDYVIPQLYWETGNHFGDFHTLVNWWNQNNYGKPLYIGQALYKSTPGNNGWPKADELSQQINFLRTKSNVKGFAFYSAGNIGELSLAMSRSLQENQLNSMAAIDDNRHQTTADVTGRPVARPLPLETANKSIFTRKEFLVSLSNHPISLANTDKMPSDVIPVLQKIRRQRILTWNVPYDSTSQFVALVVIKKAKNNQLLQRVFDVSASPLFVLSHRQWKELRRSDLLLVQRDVVNRTDLCSAFFELKRRRIKQVSDPFTL